MGDVFVVKDLSESCIHIVSVHRGGKAVSTGLLHQCLPITLKTVFSLWLDLRDGHVSVSGQIHTFSGKGACFHAIHQNPLQPVS